MANVLTENPWILDGSSLSVILVATQFKCREVLYYGYASGVTSQIKLANRFGNTVVDIIGDTDGDVQRTGFIGWIYGLQEITHTDGTVLVYFE